MHFHFQFHPPLLQMPNDWCHSLNSMITFRYWQNGNNERFSQSFSIVVHCNELRWRHGLPCGWHNIFWFSAMWRVGLFRRIQSHRHFGAQCDFNSIAKYSHGIADESAKILCTFHSHVCRPLITQKNIKKILFLVWRLRHFNWLESWHFYYHEPGTNLVVQMEVANFNSSFFWSFLGIRWKNGTTWVGESSVSSSNLHNAGQRINLLDITVFGWFFNSKGNDMRTQHTPVPPINSIFFCRSWPERWLCCTN